MVGSWPSERRLRRHWYRRRSSSPARLYLAAHLVDEVVDIIVAEARRDHQPPRFLSGFGQPVIRLDHDGDDAVFGNAKTFEHIRDLAGRSLDNFDRFFR